MGSSGLGQSIKTLRLQSNMTGTELAQRCKVTKGLISQIERGITVPSLDVLVRIADTLEVGVGQLVDTYGVRSSQHASDVSELTFSPLVRRDHRKLIASPEENQLFEFLTPTLDGPIGFMLIKIGPLDSKPAKIFEHPGEECLLVLEGELTVYLEDAPHRLFEGDSMAYPATIPHHYVCDGPEPATILLAEVPSAFLNTLGQHLSAIEEKQTREQKEVEPELVTMPG